MAEHQDSQFPVVVEGQIGGATIQTVNARDLHAFLDNGDHFATWIKDRIDQYGFAENIDFASYSESSEKGGRPRQEFALSIDMAKELGMVDRSEKGKQVRLYFIEIERRAKLGISLPDFSDPQVLLGVVNHLQSQVSAKDVVIAHQGERLHKLDRIEGAIDNLPITDAAKVLKVKPRFLTNFLHENRWIYKRPNSGHWLAYQDLMPKYLDHRDHTYKDDDGDTHFVTWAVVTPAGMVKLGGDAGSAFRW